MSAQSIKNKIKSNGVVYTPKWIVDLIIEKINFKENFATHNILDPSCGDGAFLYEIVEMIILEAKQQNLENQQIAEILAKNIYGFDIDEQAILLAKNRLNSLLEQHCLPAVFWHIKVFDCLDKNLLTNYQNYFDYIVGNPPYVRIQNLGEDRRLKIQQDWHFCKNGSTDLFIAFFQIANKLLKKDGKLGFITPNTYLKTKTAISFRYFLQQQKNIECLIDFGDYQIFKNAITYSIITIINKKHKQDYFDYYKWQDNQLQFVEKINFSDLKLDCWQLVKNDILAKIKNIEKNGTPLKNIAKISVGITTLADAYYIFDNVIFNDKYAKIQLKNGEIFEIESEILKPIIKASILKQDKVHKDKYIIFPYQLINGKHKIIAEKTLQENFPKCYDYFISIKQILQNRDSGKKNNVAWYAFGRSQGLDSSFGNKILTSPMNYKPNFVVSNLANHCFYSGYAIKFDGNLQELAKILNSERMFFYIQQTSRDYQGGYKSYAKSFIENFCITNCELEKIYQKTEYY